MKKNKCLIYIGLLNVFITIAFIYFLTKIKIWTYDNYTFFKEDDIHQTLLTKTERKNLRSVSYCYIDSHKRYYKIIKEEKIKSKYLILIELKNEDRDIVDITVPKTKKTVMSLIIETWRSKWKN